MNTMTQPALTQKCWTWFSQALTQHDTFQSYFQPLIQMIVPQWTTDAYRAEVIDIRYESDDMYSLVLKPKSGFIDRAWPTFQAGQFIELMVEKEGARVLRCFSISSSPAYFEKTGLIELSIRIQQQGRLTPWMRQQLKTGSLVNISQAQGGFVLSESASFEPEKYLFIAGGSGITPFRSMLQQLSSCASSCHEYALDIHLLYYSRGHQEVLFQQEFEQLAKVHKGLKLTFIDSNNDGHISCEQVQTYCRDSSLRTAYICGPGAMITKTQKVLSELGIVKENIYFEYFGAVPIELKNREQGAVLFQASDKVVISEQETMSSLLEQAEGAGLNPASGCRIGVCHQCLCKKKSGIVFNTRTQEYSDTGSEEIQLCISVAQGDVVLDL